MTAHQLFEQQLADAGYQLDNVLKAMPEACMDHKVTEGSMTPKEQIAHLMEAYHAFQESAAGRKYEWNTFRPASTETAALIAEFKAKRAATVATALAGDSEDKLITAHKYILGHDYYHVGQICLARLATQPDWDPYAIYQG